MKSWTILLAIITFSLSLVGTFLVRSGVLTSVHSFATDPARGTFILLLLVVAIGGSLTLYAVRAPSLKGGGLFAPVSREGALVLNNLLLSCGCATVLLGTLYPLFLDVVGGPKLSVGFPFFNRTFVPLMVPMHPGGRHRPDAVMEARRSAGRAAAPGSGVCRSGRRGAGGVLMSRKAARSWRCWARARRWRPGCRRGWRNWPSASACSAPRPPTVCAAPSTCHAPPMA